MDFRIAVYGMGRFGRALAGALPPELLVRTGGRSTAPDAFLTGLEPGALVMLAVPDDALEALASAFAGAEEAPPLTFIHPSGARGPEALQALVDAGARTGAFHILQSFPPEGGQMRVRGSYAAISGDPATLIRLHQLARVLEVTPIALSDDQRVAYHAAAVLTSNALIGLLDAGRELLEQSGIPADAAAKMLIPLARGTLENASEVGAREALTGPVVRGDIGTIKRHLEVLTGDTRGTYVAMMLAVCNTAERAGRTPPDKLAAIRELLG